MAEDRTEGGMGRGIPTGIKEQDRPERKLGRNIRRSEKKRRKKKRGKRKEETAEMGKRGENKRKRKWATDSSQKLESAPEMVGKMETLTKNGKDSHREGEKLSHGNEGKYRKVKKKSNVNNVFVQEEKTKRGSKFASPQPREPHVLPRDSKLQRDLDPPTGTAPVLYFSCLSHSKLELECSTQRQARRFSERGGCLRQ